MNYFLCIFFYGYSKCCSHELQKGIWWGLLVITMLPLWRCLVTVLKLWFVQKMLMAYDEDEVTTQLYLGRKTETVRQTLIFYVRILIPTEAMPTEVVPRPQSSCFQAVRMQMAHVCKSKSTAHSKDACLWGRCSGAHPQHWCQPGYIVSSREAYPTAWRSALKRKTQREITIWGDLQNVKATHCVVWQFIQIEGCLGIRRG